MPPTRRRRSASPVPGGSSKKQAPSRGGNPSTTNSSQTPRSNKNWKQWKKQQSHDYNTHQFLDASATVSAGLFAARRLPEIKSLWRSMVQGELNAVNDRSGGQTIQTSSRHDRTEIRKAGQSGGGKISSRHLRRRTNSHKPRRRQRYPRGKDGDVGLEGDATAGANGDASDGETMGGSRESKTGVGTSDTDRQKKQNQKAKPCRRARRKPGLLKMNHSNWWQIQTSTQLMQKKTAEPHHWIPTHLWHAKRFHMAPRLFSWSIPLVHCNRGSRASLRLASSEAFPKCTIQDASWEINGCAIKLEVKATDPSPQSTQQSMNTLVSTLQRLCGSDAPFLKDEAVLSGQRAGEVLLYEVDASPLHPIGPAKILFSSRREDDVCQGANVSILIHPAINQCIVSLLNNLCRAHDDDTACIVSLSTAPLALLRIRGRTSTSTMLEVLDRAENISILDDEANHGSLIQLGSLPTMVDRPNNGSKSTPSTIMGDSSTLVMCHKPNENYQHLPHNLASSGWDILCHPSICSQLFQSFVTSGGACAIGLVEDGRAQLEAYPPLPIFPRDYPDTNEGRAYWACSQNASNVEKEADNKEKSGSTTWKDWAVIRTCLEGSWGRINTPLKRTICGRKQSEVKNRRQSKDEEDSTLQNEQTPAKLVERSQLFGRETALVHWGSLISQDVDSTIVVRGSFGMPILQLLHGCGKLNQPKPEIDSPEDKPRRRPRRKVRPPGLSVYASPLSKMESDAHSKLCQQLSTSLSLPALLRCELYCAEKGKLSTGDLIFPITSQDDGSSTDGSEDEDSVKSDELMQSQIGVVTAGGFSPSRGRCHGVGFISAAKFIHALDGTSCGMGMTIPHSNGQKKMTLKVVIVRDATGTTGCPRSALLSILL